MSIAKYIILAATVVLISLIRFLHVREIVHLPLLEMISYLIAVCGVAWYLSGSWHPVTLGAVRAQLHRKYGFTCIFCLGCAILLTLTGLLWGPPDITRLSFPVQQEGENGYKAPEVVRPGDAVRVYIQPERRLPLTSISGLWKANVIKATLVLDEPRRLLPLPDTSSLPAEETWEDVNPRDGKLYFRPTRQDSAIPKFKNETMVPWIEFNVPYDESIGGRESAVHVEMTGVYPYLLQNGEYRTEEFRLIEDVPFYVADGAQFAAYQRYQSQYKSWEQFQRFRYYAAMTFLLCGLLFLWLLVRRPRPAGIPVRLMSRRIGQ
ncbi:MAG: hypothetical protein KC900_02285 [Candidatus Omnitrophica bacterium]|nr:hypothetical protein [Candidatus Omnitrophota bacterium]